MKNKNIVQVKSTYSENKYNVTVKKKRFSTLNLLLVQVGICLAVSVAVLAVRLIGGNEAIVSAGVNTFFDIVSV